MCSIGSTALSDRDWYFDDSTWRPAPALGAQSLEVLHDLCNKIWRISFHLLGGLPEELSCFAWPKWALTEEGHWEDNWCPNIRSTLLMDHWNVDTSLLTASTYPSWSLYRLHFLDFRHSCNQWNREWDRQLIKSIVSRCCRAWYGHYLLKYWSISRWHSWLLLFGFLHSSRVNFHDSIFDRPWIFLHLQFWFSKRGSSD